MKAQMRQSEADQKCTGFPLMELECWCCFGDERADIRRDLC